MVKGPGDLMVVKENIQNTEWPMISARVKRE